jgi:hypothetical protein
MSLFYGDERENKNDILNINELIENYYYNNMSELLFWEWRENICSLLYKIDTARSSEITSDSSRKIS